MMPDQVYPYPTATIYRLVCPITGETRYVGKAEDVAQRFRDHKSEAARSPRRRLHTWIRALARQGSEPILDVVEVVPLEHWAEAERRWIAYFRGQGHRLVNHTAGGDGICNPDAETRAKMSESHKLYRFTEERKAQHAEIFRGEANPFYGREHSDATKARIGDANRGRPCPWKGKAVAEGSWRCRLKTYICTSPEGEEFVVEHLAPFCLERGLTRSNMVSVANGKWQFHKGWKCRRPDPA